MINPQQTEGDIIVYLGVDGMWLISTFFYNEKYFDSKQSLHIIMKTALF